jgi:hypothetical protein
MISLRMNYVQAQRRLHDAATARAARPGSRRQGMPKLRCCFEGAMPPRPGRVSPALFAVYMVVLSITLTGVFVYAMLQL